MNRIFVVMTVAVMALAGCGGDDGGNNPPQACGTSNCAGCCFNNVCQTGTAASACGKSGATCAACSAAQVCKADQKCGVDPDSVWRVQPVSAQITSSNNGSSWDGDGSAPDVFVVMQCPGSTTAASTPESQSYTPTWSSGSCTAKASQLLAAPWVFQMWDSDVSSNDTITSPLGYQTLEAALLAGSVTLNPSGGMMSMTVRFQKQP